MVPTRGWWISQRMTLKSSNDLVGRIEVQRSMDVTEVIQWPSLTSKMEVILEYTLLHMWGVFSQVFQGRESEFGVRSKFRGQWRSLRLSNGLHRPPKWNTPSYTCVFSQFFFRMENQNFYMCRRLYSEISFILEVNGGYWMTSVISINLQVNFNLFSNSVSPAQKNPRKRHLRCVEGCIL